MDTEVLETTDTVIEDEYAEARLLLDWSRGLPEHRMQYEAWCEKQLTRAASSA